MKSIFIILLLFTSFDLLACSCGTVSKIDEEAVGKAKDIFIGRVLKIEPFNNRSRKITFQLSVRLKTDSSTQITILTGLGDADCGLSLKEGQEWYVFTYNYDGMSWAGLCGRSALLSEHSIQNSNKKYYRQAVKEYNKQRKRALKEINFIKRETAANIGFRQHGLLKKCSSDYLYSTTERRLSGNFPNIHAA